MAKKQPGIDGKRILRLRSEMNLQQQELVAGVNQYGVKLSQSHLSQLERNQKSVSIEALIAIAFVLDTTTDYLTGLTDDPTPRPDLEEQVILVEHDPIRRDAMQKMFTAIERMPVDMRDRYWTLLSTLYTGLVSEQTKSALGSRSKQ